VKSPRSDDSAAVDAYLARLPADARVALEDLRATIRGAAPDAREVISYRIPAFRRQRDLVYYAAYADHLSLFIGSLATSRAWAGPIAPYLGAKTALHFTADRPLPKALVRRIVRARVREDDERARRDAATAGPVGEPAKRARGRRKQSPRAGAKRA
jgi:uncharacterized protein YdhG (YjbR/CyaY superfamily)